MLLVHHATPRPATLFEVTALTSTLHADAHTMLAASRLAQQCTQLQDSACGMECCTQTKVLTMVTHPHPSRIPKTLCLAHGWLYPGHRMCQAECVGESQVPAIENLPDHHHGGPP